MIYLILINNTYYSNLINIKRDKLIRRLKIFLWQRIKKVKVGLKRKNINEKDIESDLKSFGIKTGDILLLHSSLKSIGYVKGGAKTVIKSILAVIGPEGTLCMPTYPRRGSMYGNCKDNNYIFDVKKTSTEMGAIPREFLTFKNLYRSIHPTHSISAIGKYAKMITATHHIGDKTFGLNSPWAKIVELNGKFLGIGIDLGPTTQYHYVEDLIGEDFPIKVKLDKIFDMKCRIDQNNTITVKVRPLDPDVSKTRIDKEENFFIRDYFWEIYKNLGLLNIGYVGNAKSWWVNARDFCDLLIVLSNLGITIYSTENEIKQNKLFPFEVIKEKLEGYSKNKI